MKNLFEKFEKVYKTAANRDDILAFEWNHAVGAMIHVASIEQVDAVCDNAKLMTHSFSYHSYEGTRNGIKVFALITWDKARALGLKPETDADHRATIY